MLVTWIYKPPAHKVGPGQDRACSPADAHRVFDESTNILTNILLSIFQTLTIITSKGSLYLSCKVEMSNIAPALQMVDLSFHVVSCQSKDQKVGFLLPA